MVKNIYYGRHLFNVLVYVCLKAWAIVIISGLGVLGQFLSISRNAVTRDDVWLTHNSIAPCDVIETRKGYPAPHRKVRNI